MENLASWRSRWEEYDRLRESPVDSRSLDQILRDLDFLYSCFSEEVRATDPDPGKEGWQHVTRILAEYERRRACGPGSAIRR